MIGDKVDESDKKYSENRNAELPELARFHDEMPHAALGSYQLGCHEHTETEAEPDSET